MCVYACHAQSRYLRVRPDITLLTPSGAHCSTLGVANTAYFPAPPFTISASVRHQAAGS